MRKFGRATRVDRPCRLGTQPPELQAWDSDKDGATNIIGQLQSGLKLLGHRADLIDEKERLRLLDDFDASEQCLDSSKLESDNLSQHTSCSAGYVADSDTGNVAENVFKNVVVEDLSGPISNESIKKAAIDRMSNLGEEPHSVSQDQATEVKSPGLSQVQLLDSIPDASIPTWGDHESSLDGSTLLIQRTQVTDTKRFEFTQYEKEGIGYMSVTSNDEDITSQAPRLRTEPELLAIQLFASCFAELQDLRELHKELLEKLGEKRFVENY